MNKPSVPRVWQSADQPSFTKRFELDVDDYLAVHYTTPELLPLWSYAIAVMLIALFAAFVAAYPLWRDGRVVDLALVSAAVAIASLVLAGLTAGPARRLWRRMWSRMLEKRQIIGVAIESTIDRDGLSYFVGGQTSQCPWDALHAIEEEGGTFYFWTSRIRAYVWPGRIFDTDEERLLFAQHVEAWSGMPIVSPPLLARLGEAGRMALP